MKANIATSILLPFIAALIPGLARAIDIKAPAVPTVHVQIPHVVTPHVNGHVVTPQLKSPTVHQQRRIVPPGSAVNAPAPTAGGGQGGGIFNANGQLSSIGSPVFIKAPHGVNVAFSQALKNLAWSNDPAEPAFLAKALQAGDKVYQDQVAIADAQMQAVEAQKGLPEAGGTNLATVISAPYPYKGPLLLRGSTDPCSRCVMEKSNPALELLEKARSKLLEKMSDIEKAKADTDNAIVENMKQ